MSDANRLSVLIVEDEALVLNIHRKIVERAGHKVRWTATTLSEALSTVDTFSEIIDAALLDLNLSGVSSEPVAKALAAANIPFLVVTGYSEDYVRDISIVAPVLSKPFRHSALVEWLNALARQ